MEPPEAQVGVKREWVNSTYVCGRRILGYWQRTVRCKPGPNYIWEANIEEWLLQGDYINRDIEIDSNIIEQKRKRDRDQISNQCNNNQTTSVSEPDDCVDGEYEMVNSIDYFYRP